MPYDSIRNSLMNEQKNTAALLKALVKKGVLTNNEIDAEKKK